MCKKLIYLIWFVLVIGLAASARADLAEWEAAISAKNPLHWYKFNEATGTDCIDSGSAGLDGVYTGVSLGQEGYFGGGTAARFTRSNANVVNFTGATDLSGLWTAEYIVKTVKPPAGNEAQALHDSATTSVRLAGWTALGEAGFTLYGVADYRFTPTAGLTLDDLVVQQDEWMHLVWRNDGSGMQLFFNGKLVGTNTNAIALGRLRIGSHGAVTNALDGVFDEAVVFARALTDADIIAHAKAASLIDESIFKASSPDPADGAEGVTIPLLQWAAGTSAAFHDVYLGTIPDLGPANLVTRNPKTMTVHYHGAGLEPGTTYYWRIDEVEADGTTVHTGDVWSFTVAPLTAWNPNPPDDAKWVDTEAELSWSAGLRGVTHDVYFGTDEAAVANGTGDTFKAKQAQTTYDPGTLTKDTTYYWRVDDVETDGTTKHTGEVWSFKTLPDIPVADPNLLAWWKLDKGYGSTVLDWSGHGNDGTLANGPQWVAGYDGSALDFDGTDDYVDLGTPSELYLPENYTYTAWFKVGRDIDGDSGPQYLLCIGSRSDLLFGVEDGVGTNGDLSLHYYDTAPGFHAVGVGQTVWSSDEWHMVAGTKDSAVGHKIYLDGELKNSDTNTNNDNYATSRMISLGARAWTGHQYFNGTIDDVRIYNRTLTQDEIKQVMRIDPLLAWDPSPLNRSTPDIDRAIPLVWKPGEKAAQHDVYLGTDETAVTEADASDTTGIYRGRQAATSYSPGEALVWGQTYYWRIDEYNTDATITPGRVWIFTVSNYLVPDDFESYDDYCNRIFYAWKDGWGHSADPDCGVAASGGNGTGSTVGNLSAPFAEQNIVHSGRQSMPLAYDNTGTGGKARYSETQREWASPQDWTKGEVKALTLWFHGDAGNTTEQLYVAVEDNAGHVEAVNHPEPEAVRKGRWQEWPIELTQFSNAGVNLAAVKKMYIGLGNRVSPQAGGTGTIYIDDIRVYKARCVPSLATLEADLSGNCVVDYADIEILANEWLGSGYLVTPQQPSNASLLAHYTFDGDTNDSSGNAHHGGTSGDPQWVAGRIGNALEFDGTDDEVSVIYSTALNPPDNFTVSAWAKAASGGTGYRAVISSRTEPPQKGYIIYATPGNIWQFWTGTGSGWQSVSGPSVSLDEWVHLAAIYTDGTKRLYANGVLAVEAAGTYVPNDADELLIGAGANETVTHNYFFVGAIDDVRIYGSVLSRDEVAWLAGYTSPFSEPFDLNVDGTVDFQDFAVLADSWLEELLWP